MSSRQLRFPGRNGTIMPESSLIAPESLNGSIDYSAFSPDKKPVPLYLGLFPQRIVNEIRDQRVEIRRAAINTIQESLQETDDDALIEGLQGIITLVAPPLKDSNFKIVLIGLEIVDHLVERTGHSLLPFVCMLLSNYLDKVWSHKFVVKQAGMKVLLNMMSSLTPSPVIDQVIDIGINHKQAKVREETLNIIIASLLTFPDSHFSLYHLVDNITPLLSDSRQKVRQACLELCAVLSDRLGKEGSQYLLKAVLDLQLTLNINSSNEDNGLLHCAFENRLARHQLPKLNGDGLVDHIVNVANGRDPGELCGLDVDWILAGKSSSPGINGRKQSTSGPLKSAGKKLPWDKEQPKVGGYASIALKQHNSSNGLGPPPTGSTVKPLGYADIHKDSSIHDRSSHHLNGSFTTAPSFKLGKTSPNKVGGLSSGPMLGSLSTTWPRQSNNYGTNPFMKNTTTTRQISADNSILGGNITSGQPAKLPAIGNNNNNNQRPSSKPIVRNPLPFHPQPPPLPSHSLNTSQQTQLVLPSQNTLPVRNDSPTVIEESFLYGGGYGDEDTEYFNIPVDESQLNSSLSSSLTSLLFPRDISSSATTATGDRIKNELQPPPHTVDSLSQIRKKAASWKAEILSAQCSTSTSPTGTPPCGRTHKQILPNSNNRLEAEPVSAPIVLKKERVIKDKKNGSFTKSINGGLVFNHKDKETTLTHQWTRIINTEFQSKTTTTTPIKGLYKSPPRHVAIEQDTLYDLEANPEYLSPPKMPPPTHNITPSNRKIKKLSPTKAASAPQKSYSNTLTGSNVSNSAPVYRLGSQDPSIIDEDLPSDSKVVELLPIPNPDVALRKALEGLGKGTEEWEEKIDSLLLLRRLSACHTNVILPQLPTVLIAVEKEVKNLRSQVARNAIACLGDMFGYLGKDMEMSLDTIVKSLLYVGSKSNVFYKEDTEKALYELCTRVSPARVLTALMNGGLHSNNQAIRRQVARFMSFIVENNEAGRIIRLPRDVLDRIIHATSSLLGDADPIARYHARKMAYELFNNPDLDLLASKTLASHQFTKMREIVENIKTKGLGKPPLDSQSAKTTRSSTNNQPPSCTTTTTTNSNTSSQPPLSSSTGQSPPSKPKKRRSSATAIVTTTQGSVSDPSPETNATIMSIVTRMKANDWKERQEAITELDELIVANPNCLGGSNLVKVFDVFNDRLSDKNSKVNIHALNAFQSFVCTISHQLQPILPTLVEALAVTLASRYPAIHSAALNAVDLLIKAVDPTLIFSPLASAAQNGNARVQPIMLRKLADLIPLTCTLKPALVQRVALPVLWKILSSRSPATGEAKSAHLQLLDALSKSLGPALEASATQQSPIQQQKLNDMLRSLKHGR